MRHAAAFERLRRCTEGRIDLPLHELEVPEHGGERVLEVVHERLHQRFLQRLELLELRVPCGDGLAGRFELHEQVPRAQQGADLRHELVTTHGLRDEVVGAGIETFDAVRRSVESGDQGDLAEPGAPSAFQTAADLEPRQVRHHDVEQHQIRRPLVGERKSRTPVGGRPHVVARAQEILLQELPVPRVVVHHQDVRRLGADRHATSSWASRYAPTCCGNRDKRIGLAM
jgi:hypothetical protein